MKLRILFSIFLISAINVIAQSYPEVTIKDVNFVSDSALLAAGANNTEPAPPMVGDTVVVTGVIMNAPYFNVNPDDGEMLSAGAPAAYIQDTSMTEWSGVLLRDPANTVHPAFANLDSGLVVKVTAEVVEYYTTTELDVVSFEPSDIIGLMPRPKPVPLTLDSLFETGTANPNYLAEKWEGVYVELYNLTTSDPNVVGGGTFRVFDGNNTSMIVYNKGNYYRNTFEAPQAGTAVERIRGYIETRTTGSTDYGWFMINPVYEDDIVFGEVSPPNISNVERDKIEVGYGEEVLISAKVIDSDSTADVTGVSLFYSAGEDGFMEVAMTLTNPSDSTYSATIPGFNDSTVVRFYVSAIDADNAEVTNPNNPELNSYFYLVLDRPITIKDVQFSPFGSGYSAFNGYEVTVTGTVTADTTDIEGDGSNVSPQVYIQDSSEPWSGVQIFGSDVFALRKTDNVTVTGIVNESYGITRIGTLTEGAVITKNGTGFDLPEPVVLSTEVIDFSSGGSLPAESYEGMLITIENVTVTDENADGEAGPNGNGNGNYGEILVADSSGENMRVETQDGTHDYNNFWDASQEESAYRISEGNTFESITGVLFFSFSNFKLVPRSNDDFVGFVTSIDEEVLEIPNKYSLAQNYPNPFNPSTIIEYSVPKQSNVKIQIYNLLGQKISTLVNSVKNAGSYKINFDSSQLSTGIYFYSIQAGEFTQTKKMMLVK